MELIELLLLAFVGCGCAFVFWFADRRTRNAFIPIAVICAILVVFVVLQEFGK